MNRFQCSFKNCERILDKEGNKSFKCTACGHGTMGLIKPRAYCETCKKSIYANIDLRPDEKSREGYYLICDDCTVEKVEYIAGLEKQLHTEFIDTEDMKEKMLYYNTKVQEAEEQHIPITTIGVKGLGSRLKAIRKRLNLTQTQLAEFFNMQSRSTVLQYEKNTRKVPEDINEWIKTSEGIFKHIGREKGEVQIMEKFLNHKKGEKKSVTLQKRANPLGESSQFEGGYVG